MSKSRFTRNKQIVRDLQLEMIKKHFRSSIGKLKYFGLPSDEMKDIRDWAPFFSKFIGVERGDPPDCWKKQHFLLVNAFKFGFLSKLFLLRGDIDRIILTNRDDANKIVEFPFDVINLDYSGGLLYRDDKREQYRLKAIRKLIEKQAEYKINYLLFISTNLDNSKDGEIKLTFENIRTELKRAGYNADEVIDSYLNHDMDEVRLKIYIPYFINQIATSQYYNCETEKIIFYLGNRGTRMMNFRFYLKYDPRTTAPRFPRERLSQIINSPMIKIKDGKYHEVSLNLPKLKRIYG